MGGLSRRIYKKPPIVEAICEFRFPDDVEWDVLAPARFYDRVRREYSGTPRLRYALQGLASDPSHPPSTAPVRPEVLIRTQLLTADGKAIVALAPHLLSISVLSPYPGWEAFHRRIVAALSHYFDLFAPSGVISVGIRYINRIVLPDPEVDLARYFHAPPVSPPPLPEQIGPFLQRTEYRYQDGLTKLLLTFTSVDDRDAHAPTVVLDLDVQRTAASAHLSLDDSLPVIDELRDLERAAFEGFITDETRALFDV